MSSRFYEGWSAIQHGTSEGQPGVYGNLNLPDPAGVSSLPSVFSARRSPEEIAAGYVSVPSEVPELGQKATPEH